MLYYILFSPVNLFQVSSILSPAGRTPEGGQEFLLPRQKKEYAYSAVLCLLRREIHMEVDAAQPVLFKDPLYILDTGCVPDPELHVLLSLSGEVGLLPLG